MLKRRVVMVIAGTVRRSAPVLIYFQLEIVYSWVERYAQEVSTGYWVSVQEVTTKLKCSPEKGESRMIYISTERVLENTCKILSSG